MDTIIVVIMIVVGVLAFIAMPLCIIAAELVKIRVCLEEIGKIRVIAEIMLEKNKGK